jgi:hypothetical protein
MAGYAGFNLGLINAAKRTVKKLDEKVQTKKSTALPSLNKLSEFGGFGSANGQLKYPYGIFSDGISLYVDDENNYRIQKFNLAGDFISWFGKKSGVWGYYTTGSADAATINGCRSIYVDSNTVLSIETIFSDISNSAIYKFNQAGNKIGQILLGNGQLSFTTDTLGRTIVCSTWDDICTIYTQVGAIITTFGGSGGSDGKFNAAYSIMASLVTDSSNNIFIADSGTNRIQKFDSNGNFLTKWDSANRTAIAIDENNNIYTFGSSFAKYTSSGVLLKTYNPPSCTSYSQISVRNNKLYCVDNYSNKVLIYQIP